MSRTWPQRWSRVPACTAIAREAARWATSVWKLRTAGAGGRPAATLFDLVRVAMTDLLAWRPDPPLPHGRRAARTSA
ncbi:hypothetical protein [Streptomyces sp. NPDC091649]|uniref:hypothetical protein n=1 Tax=Streptomyces sp. NPDC091649 TaxID=3366004 RepID=UPI0038283F75